MSENKNIEIFKLIIAELRNTKNIFIPIHIGPDGDSVGSAATLHLLGKRFGYDWPVFSADNVPEYIKEFIDVSMVIEKVVYEETDFSKFELALVPDISEEKLLTRKENFRLPEELRKIVIDHHDGNTQWGNINLIYSNISSTCALLYELLKNENLLTPEMFPYLTLGILTDTGVFKNADTSAKDFKYLGEMFEGGFNVSELIRNMRKENVEQKIFKKIIYKNLDIDKEHKFVFSYYTLDDLKTYHLEDSAKKFGNGVAELTNVKDYDFAFFIAEKEDRGNKRYTISFRSINYDFDVAAIASRLDTGGGHKTAAGGLITDCENIEEAIAKVLWTISSGRTSH